MYAFVFSFYLEKVFIARRVSGQRATTNFLRADSFITCATRFLQYTAVVSAVTRTLFGDPAPDAHSTTRAAG